MSAIIAGIDIETTGLEQEKGHRIIEICCSLYDLDARQKRLTWSKRINPHRSILADAERVHGISISDLANCPSWEETAPTVQAILKKCHIIVGHNGDSFDFPFIAAELVRVGLQPPNPKTFDTMVNARWATPFGKLPKLQELCFALGIEYDPAKAHAAEYDVDVMMSALWEGIDRGAFILPTLQEKAA